MLPVMLDVRGRSVLIIGGGNIALRKAKTFLAEGAVVSIVSPKILPELAAQKVNYTCGVYERSLIRGHFIIIAATDDTKLNLRIAADARNEGILCLSGRSGDIFSMVYERSGNITVALSTNGSDPSFAKSARSEIKELCGRLE